MDFLETPRYDVPDPPEPMTLEQAVAVLNRERHGEPRTPWFIAPDGEPEWGQRGSAGADLTAFEAIAIAEKYEREAVP